MEAAIERIEYDVAEEDYGEFIDALRTVLAEYEPVGDRRSVVDIHHAPHPVLPRQRSPHRPARWILVTLLVRGEGHATTLAIRDDNVYLIGFRNRRGQWFEFGFSGAGGRSARVLPAEWNSTFLECDVGYGSIVGGAMNLVGLGLGRWFARDAVRRLSAYEAPAGGGAVVVVDERTRRHLARLIVMVCEAARMIPHFETVLDGWDRCTGAMAERQVHLLWNWKLMSHAVLSWDQWWNRTQRQRYAYVSVSSSQPPTWPPELVAPQVDVRNVGQALQVVQLLLNWSGPRALGPSQPPPPPPQDPAADGGSGADDGGGDIMMRHWNGDVTIAYVVGRHGQCMLEVFGMRAGFYMCGGGATISVFDGMRGQIIYSNDDDDDHGRRTMLGSLEQDDAGDQSGDSDIDQYGRHFGERIFAHLRSIYDWAGVIGGWSRHSQTTKTTITSKREINGSMLGHDLELTGPYRAISVYGSVSIEIDSYTTDSNSNSNVEHGISTTETDYVRIDISKKDGYSRSDGSTTTKSLLWDCYNDDDNAAAADDDAANYAAYDTVLTRTISTSHGPLEVTYAVLSDAVEATVQVRLLLAAAAADFFVHGRITAGCRDLDAQSVLFRRDAEEKVAVTRDSHVPLSRSVVAVPLASQLLILAALHTSVASSNHTAAEGLLPDDQPLVARFRPELSGQELQSFGIDGGQVEIKVIWALDF